MKSRYEQLRERIAEDPMFSMVNFRHPLFLRGRPFVSHAVSQNEAMAMTPYELMKTLEKAGIY